MRRMRAVPIILVLSLTASIGLTARAATSGVERAPHPAPLSGAPLSANTGLRLLVADNPPFVLQVDTGRVIPVARVPAVSRGPLWVVGVGGRAAVVVASSRWLRADLYGVRNRVARVSRLGTGVHAWPAGDGRSVWVQSAVESGCTVRQVGLDGRRIRAPRRFPCATVSDPAGGALGLVVGRTRILDPLTGKPVLKTQWGIWAVAGTKLVLAGPEKQFTLLDTTTGAARRMPWPSILGSRDQPAVDPRGRFVALAFAVPSWSGGARQVLDVWLLDTKTEELTQLPGMPAFVSLKGTSMAWTDDGRLVLLGESNGKDVVAVWRPGQRRLGIKTLSLPDRSDNGSDSFALLR
jgi:hypothetical protein